MHMADPFAFHGWCLALNAAPLALGGASRSSVGLVHEVNGNFLRLPRPSPRG